MTEAKWLTCADPHSMLEFLRTGSRVSDRKLRLFGCACVRRIWHLLTDEQSRRAVEMSEGFADGLVSERKRRGELRRTPRGSPQDTFNPLASSAENRLANALEWGMEAAARALDSPDL